VDGTYGDTHGGGGAGRAGVVRADGVVGVEEDGVAGGVGGVAHGDEQPAPSSAQPSTTAATRRTPAIPPR
jgi:hypothetical protein